MAKKTKKNSRAKSIAVALTFAGLLASGSYAFTAANTVDASKAGEGAGTVSGYAVTGVHYNLNASDPATADSVTFNLDSTPKAGSTLKAQVVTGGNWFNCTNTAAAVTCTLTGGVSISSINTLRVLAAD